MPCIGTMVRMATPCAGVNTLETMLMAASERVEAPGGVDGEQEEAEAGAEEVGGDERGSDIPAVDEYAADDAEDGDGEHVGDLDAGDLLRAGLHHEGEEHDDGDESDEVSEGGDDLGVPHAAQGGDGQDFAHGERSGSRGCGGGFAHNGRVPTFATLRCAKHCRVVEES